MSNEVKYAIYGAGGFGMEVYCYLRDYLNALNANSEFIGFFDDGIEKGLQNQFGNIIGGITEVNNINFKLNLIIAIANPQIRMALQGKINNTNIIYPNIISADFKFFDMASTSLGKGNIIFSKSSISLNSELGNFNIVNGNISIGHDTKIGNFNTFFPGTRISGLVKIGNSNQFGMNSSVAQGTEIGNGNKFAPNSVVLKNIGNDGTYFQGILKKL
jgi:acetyltransferase-like isoleucine patch superfamily enzyme